MHRIEQLYLDFFHLFVIRRRGAIQKGSNLSPEVCCSYECSQDVLRKNVSEGRCIVLNVIIRNVYVL